MRRITEPASILPCGTVFDQGDIAGCVLLAHSGRREQGRGKQSLYQGSELRAALTLPGQPRWPHMAIPAATAFIVGRSGRTGWDSPAPDIRRADGSGDCR